MTNRKITISIAGTTQNTVKVAETLLENPNFSIELIITPSPKKIGRKQILTQNPMDSFAKKHNIKKILIDKKIDENAKIKIIEHKNIDILLVVDFGYYIPKWLLQWPTLAPLNIHPSALPQWRGSSPGQFSLLFGDKKSAITLMKINEVLDQGDIIFQEFFEVEKNWTQVQYYQQSFDLMCKKLPKLILEYVEGKIEPQKQPETSPFPIARQLSKDDSFVEWKYLQLATRLKYQDFDLSEKPDFFHGFISNLKINPILTTILNNVDQEMIPFFVYNAQKAFSPWPELWTFLPTTNGIKRMKVIEFEFVLDLDQKAERLEIKTVQIEGKNKSRWKDIKRAI